MCRTSELLQVQLEEPRVRIRRSGLAETGLNQARRFRRADASEKRLSQSRARSSDFRSVPSFFAVASSQPIADIVDERTAAIYELGTEFIQLSPSGQIEPEEQTRFANGLVEMRQRLGLYKQDPEGVRISEGVLYQARIALPSNVTTGQYTAETFAIADGRVLASATAEIEVVKVGLEGSVVYASQEWALFYGLGAIALSLGMGWIAGQAFARIS